MKLTGNWMRFTIVDIIISGNPLSHPPPFTSQIKPWLHFSVFFRFDKLFVKYNHSEEQRKFPVFPAILSLLLDIFKCFSFQMEFQRWRLNAGKARYERCRWFHQRNFPLFGHATVSWPEATEQREASTWQRQCAYFAIGVLLAKWELQDK